MPWYEGLKQLLKGKFDIDINVLSNINLSNLVTINIVKDEKPSIDGNKVYVPMSLVKDSLPQAIQEGNTLLGEGSRELLLDFKKSESGSSATLDFFRPIISPEDCEALRASLYVRDCFLRREDEQKVSSLKNDIVMKFGRRGGRISNLCTSGYFDNFFKPFYEDVLRSSKDKEEALQRFTIIYSIIVNTEDALAVFIHHEMNKEKVKKNIEDAIKRSKQYNFSYICIHGIGKQNCLNIKASIRELSEVYSFLEDSTEEDQIIACTLKKIQQRA